MKKLLKICLVLATSSLLFASETAENLANEKCGSCHLMGEITKEKLDKMKAPPYWAIAKMVKIAHQDEADMVNFIVDFTLNPSEEKMLFPQETKKRFGLMPSQKNNVTEDELRQISEYILEVKTFQAQN